MAESAPTHTLDDIEWLASRTRDGKILSCYVDMSFTGGVRPLWREHLKENVRTLEQLMASDKDALGVFQRSMGNVETTLSNPGLANHGGMAVFARPESVHAFSLTSPVANRLVFDEEPYLIPLLEHLHRQRHYLVIHTDTHRGRLYAAVGRNMRLLEDLDESVPKRQRAAGELWGKQQATIARHREDHVLKYFKELVRATEHSWNHNRYAGIVLLGEHEVLERVRKMLPVHLAQAVVHEAPHGWSGKQPSLVEKLESIQNEATRSSDDELLTEVRLRLREQHRIAIGPADVIAAIRGGQVGYPGSVVMEADRGESAGRCSRCGAVFAVPCDRCSFCQSLCEKANLWQEVALLAARHQIPVHFLASGLDEQEGMVALLARDVPESAAIRLA